jgi:VWFA-related protein
MAGLLIAVMLSGAPSPGADAGLPIPVFPTRIYPVRLRVPGLRETDLGPFNYSLGALARETGGRACFPMGAQELDGAYDWIAEELRTEYALAYVSTRPQPDGRWRSIAVQTTGAGVTLRHKAGYYPRDLSS